MIQSNFTRRQKTLLKVTLFIVKFRLQGFKPQVNVHTRFGYCQCCESTWLFPNFFHLCNSEIFRLIQAVFIIQLTQVLDEIPVIIYATLFV